MASDQKATHYRQLLVWQRAMALVKAVYLLTSTFPKEEVYGLSSQLRRAAVSVPSNIAEGQARRTTGEFLQFISQAEGSLAEVDTQLVLSVELGLVNPRESAEAMRLMDECQRMLKAMRASLTTRQPHGHR